MVPEAAACDRVRHGRAVPLGRHLLTPPPQRRRPRVLGARRGTPPPEPSPEPRLSAPLPALPPAARTQGSPRPGSRNHAAPPTARGRHRLYLGEDPARLPAWVPPTSRAPKAHIPGEGGRNHRGSSRSLNARLNHSDGGQGKGGERKGGAHHPITNRDRVFRGSRVGENAKVSVTVVL